MIQLLQKMPFKNMEGHIHTNIDTTQNKSEQDDIRCDITRCHKHNDYHMLNLTLSLPKDWKVGLATEHSGMDEIYDFHEEKEAVFERIERLRRAGGETDIDVVFDVRRYPSKCSDYSDYDAFISIIPVESENSKPLIRVFCQLFGNVLRVLQLRVCESGLYLEEEV